MFYHRNSIMSADGTRLEATGQGQQVDGVSGNINMRFTSFQPWVTVDVLDTDYDNYNILYSCTNILGIHTIDNLWIFMRKPNQIGSDAWNILSTKTKQIITEKLGFKYAKDDYLRPTIQGGSYCIYDQKGEKIKQVGE